MHQFQKTFAPNHNTFSTGVIIYYQTTNALLWKSLQNHHNFLRSKFDLPAPPPKKKLPFIYLCLISPPKKKHGSHLKTPTLTPPPLTLDPPAASHPKPLERDSSISFGSLNWAFATRDSRDSGGMLKRQVLILPTPPKKGLKIILYLHWLIWSQKKTGNFFCDPWRMQGGQIINWCLEKARCVSFSQVSWVVFSGIHG